MRSFLSVFVLLLTSFVAYGSSSHSDTIKIAVMTDIHYLDGRLAAEGEVLTAYQNATGRNIIDLHEVLDVVLADLHNEIPDLLLITGDITNQGEKQSHIGFIEKIRSLQSLGTRILVIPGNHDINIPDAKAYHADRITPTETISKEDFATLYAPFGYGDASRRDKASLSYLVEISKSVWLLCFDTNRYEEHTTSSITGGRILPETMIWALDILHAAREKGIMVLGMMHHGLVEHMPYQSVFFQKYLVDDWAKNADLLADAGLRVVFTGHFHANDITLRTSPNGNVIYDVETASLAQYPFAYRIMELDETTLSVDTRFVTSVTGNPDLERVYRDKLEIITRRVAERVLGRFDIPLSPEMLTAFTDVIIKLNLMHVKGDEKPDLDTKMAVRTLANLMDSEADLESLELDFPPEDNRVVIPLR